MILSQYCEKVLPGGCKGACGIASHCHSNIVGPGAPSLLRLHRAVELAAAMVRSVPSDCHPPPWLQRGAPRRRQPPAEARGGLAACEEEPRRQKTINMIALDELVELFACSG